jgi:hypothetical protein
MLRVIQQIVRNNDQARGTGRRPRGAAADPVAAVAARCLVGCRRDESRGCVRDRPWARGGPVASTRGSRERPGNREHEEDRDALKQALSAVTEAARGL